MPPIGLDFGLCTLCLWLRKRRTPGSNTSQYVLLGLVGTFQLSSSNSSKQGNNVPLRSRRRLIIRARIFLLARGCALVIPADLRSRCEYGVLNVKHACGLFRAPRVLSLIPNIDYTAFLCSPVQFFITLTFKSMPKPEHFGA